MDQADQQDRSCRACGPTCNRMGMSIMAPQPAPAQRQAGLKLGQRLLTVATTAAALLVGLNALVQALNVLARGPTTPRVPATNLCCPAVHGPGHRHAVTPPWPEQVPRWWCE